jgi:hypothetical protein
MSIRQWMVQRTNIERNGNLAPDAYGQPDAPTWYPHLVQQSCYFWEPSSQRGEQMGERNADIYSHRMVVPKGTDITEEDRVNGVADRTGTVITTGVFDIKQIVRKPNHLLLVLEAVQS